LIFIKKRKIKKMKHQFETFVYENQLDSFGHLNNARYLEFYEQARWDWLASSGVTLDEIKKAQVGPVVLGINISFVRELKARQKIWIETEAVSYIKKIFKVKQEMYLAENRTLVSIAEITGGLFDLQERKLLLPDSEWLKKLAVEWKIKD